MIEIINLTKKYGTITAVNDISFTLETGKIYGLLGQNGAGKSTTMNMITGCLAPTDGEIVINGTNLLDNPLTAKRCIGYLPETPPLYADMTPFEYLKFVASAKSISKKDINDEIDNAMERTGIISVKDRLIKHLSKGYKQRVGIAQAILGNPEYIILDEPTVGLDPTQMIEIRELIRELGNNKTVILSSHILSEVANICDEVLVIAQGKLVAMDTPENLTSHFNTGNILNILLRTDEYDKCLSVIDSIENIISIKKSETYDDGTIRFILDTGEMDIRDVIFYTMADNRMPIIEMSLSRPTLEEVFIELTSDIKEEQPYITDVEYIQESEESE